MILKPVRKEASERFIHVKAQCVDESRTAESNILKGSPDEMQGDLLDDLQEIKLKGTELRSRIAAMIIVHARTYRVTCVDVK